MHSLTLQSLSLAHGILQSLILASWSFAIASLTLYNLSQERDRLQSLTLQSLSLTEVNGFEPLSFKDLSLEDGKQELEENLATNLLKRRAETNSFSRISLQERNPAQEAKTNSFSIHSFRGILSLYWPIFLLCSFQLVCSALFLKTSFPIQSLQPEELTAAYSNKSFEKTLDSFQQHDLDDSLSFLWFSLSRCSFQFQPESFNNSSFEQRALPCAAFLHQPKISHRQLQDYQVQSFQLTGRYFSFSLVSGGAFSTALHTRASPKPLHCPASTLPSLSFEDVKLSCKIALRRSTLSAWTLISLSLAITAWLNIAGLRACRGRSLSRRSLLPTTFPTSFRRAASTTASLAIPFRSTRSLRTTSFKDQLPQDLPQEQPSEEQVAREELCLQCFCSASCSTSSSAPALEERSLRRRMSF